MPICLSACVHAIYVCLFLCLQLCPADLIFFLSVSLFVSLQSLPNCPKFKCMLYICLLKFLSASLISVMDTGWIMNKYTSETMINRIIKSIQQKSHNVATMLNKKFTKAKINTRNVISKNLSQENSHVVILARNVLADLLLEIWKHNSCLQNSAALARRKRGD